MYNSKNSFRKNQLNSNSTLFLQLGIILALIIVYSFFELEFSKKTSKLPKSSTYTDELTFIIPDFTIEKNNLEKEIKKKKPLDLTNIKIDEPIDNSIPNDFLNEEPQTNINIDSLLNGIIEVHSKEEEEEDDPLPISLVEQAPRYPGCNKKTEIEFKKCLNDKIVKFVSKKFNPNLASEMNIHGKLKIQVQFEIDKNGDIINIKARSSHKKLEKEAKRVIGKLPKMIPAKQQNKNVGVRYNLPILYSINN